jgi:hypothetical protein
LLAAVARERTLYPRIAAPIPKQNKHVIQLLPGRAFVVGVQRAIVVVVVGTHDLASKFRGFALCERKHSAQCNHTRTQHGARTIRLAKCGRVLAHEISVIQKPEFNNHDASPALTRELASNIRQRALCHDARKRRMRRLW